MKTLRGIVRCCSHLVITASLFLSSSIKADEEAFFEWFGDTPLPGSEEFFPLPVEGELGVLKELSFTKTSGNPSDGKYFSPRFPEGTYNQISIGFFIKPERPKGNESLVYLRDSNNPLAGLVFRRTWGRWGLLLGRDSTHEKLLTETMQANIITGEWNHVAVTFNSGSVKFYKNGLLIEETTSKQKEFTISPRSIFRIGAGPGLTPKLYDAYSGRMAGIFIAFRELNEQEIHQMMERATP